MPVLWTSHLILAIYKSLEGVIFVLLSLTTFEVKQAGLNTRLPLIAASGYFDISLGLL